MRMQPELRLKISSHVFIASVFLLTAMLTVVIARFAMAGSHAAALNHSISQMLEAARKNEPTMLRAQTVTNQNYPKGLKGVDVFRASLDQAAKNRNVEVAEFRAGTDMIPFITRFAKDSADAGWFQVAVHVSLHGRLTDVMACLQDLKSSEAIYEVQSMEMGRYKVTKEQTDIAATAEIGVITRASEEKA